MTVTNTITVIIYFLLFNYFTEILFAHWGWQSCSDRTLSGQAVVTCSLILCAVFV